MYKLIIVILALLMVGCSESGGTIVYEKAFEEAQRICDNNGGIHTKRVYPVARGIGAIPSSQRVKVKCNNNVKYEYNLKIRGNKVL